jgi:phage terminase large subunit
MRVNYPTDLSKIINQEFIPLFSNRDRYLLLWGGRGSSKSNFTAKKLVKDCLKSRYFRQILIRDTYASIKDSQYQTIKDEVYERGLESLFHFKENPLEIQREHGTKRPTTSPYLTSLPLPLRSGP